MSRAVAASEPPHKTYQLGLTGYPLAHSLSPQIHQAALQNLGLCGEYRLFPVPPAADSPAGLAALIAALRRGELHGFNVTIPHKQTLARLVDELTPAAHAIGAVNTVYQKAGRVIGDNTDAPAFMTDLMRHAVAAGPEHRRALVLGAGGAARAVVYGLANTGWQVFVAARRPEQAAALQNTGPADHIHPISFNPAGYPTDFTLLVNTTPLGMSPGLETSPWPEEKALPAGCLVYDLVYNPAETRLIRFARRAGHPAANGLGMLVEQAAQAFEIWTGQPAPRPVMQNAATLALTSNRPHLTEEA